MSELLVRTTAAMGTVVTIAVVVGELDAAERQECERHIGEAIEWFTYVERVCSRFDAGSEVLQLATHDATPVVVSTVLYEATRYAIAVAEASGGAFDPTVGHRLETLGFNREHRTGRMVRTALPTGEHVTYRDVLLDESTRTITLARPLILDLGAVVKGLAVDMAARVLQRYPNFGIDAGGDLYLAGTNPQGNSWSVGIRHPRQPNELFATLRVSDLAVCTSGDYEQRAASASGHHILDARSGSAAMRLASVTVIAPSAMVADALGTAAFALGPSDGLAFLQRHGAEGLLVTPRLERFATEGMARFLADESLARGLGQ